jgi:hypothetical protein
MGHNTENNTTTKSSIFWDTKLRNPLSQSDVSEDHAAPIFRVEEEAKQETWVKQAASLPPAWLILRP